MSADSVVKNQAILVCALVGRIVLFVAVTSALGRTLAPADFGFVALISGFFAVALEFLDMGTTAVATRQIAAQPASERSTLAALLALRRLLATALFAGVVGVAFSGHFPRGDQQAALIVAAFGIFLLHLTAYSVVFQVRQAYRQAVVLALGMQLAFALASIAALRLHAGGTEIALLIVAFQILQALGSRWVGQRLLGYRLRAAWLEPGMLPLLKAGWQIGVAGVNYKLATYAGGFILWEMASPEALASFNAAQRLLIPVTDMAWMFVTPLIASLSVSAAHSVESFRLQLEAFAKFLLAVAALVAVTGYFAAPLLLRLLYGEQYSSGPWSAVGVFQWLALACLVTLVTPVLVVGELAQGRARALMFMSSGALCISLAGNTWAIPSYGAVGVAVVLLASEAFVFVVLFARCVARRELKVDGAWAIYLVPAALLGVLLSMLAGSPVLQLALACVWAPAALIFIVQLPAQKACRASLAAAAEKRPPESGPLAPSTLSVSR